MSNNRLLTDAEIVSIILGPTTALEYTKFAPSVLAIWRPRFDQASAKAIAVMQAEREALCDKGQALVDAWDHHEDWKARDDEATACPKCTWDSGPYTLYCNSAISLSRED